MTDEGSTDRAATLLELGRYDEALRLLAPLVASGQDPVPHALAVVCLVSLGRYEDAAGVATTALAAFGPLPELARVASYAFRGAGEPEQALAAAHAAVHDAPNWVPGLIALTEAETAMRHRAEAEAALSEALTRAPDDPEVRLVAAGVAAAWDDRKLARKHCLEALRLDPSHASALRALGRLEERSNHIGKAANWYAKALQLRPADEHLAGQVRALFGRLLGGVMAACMLASLATFLGFMAWAVPAPHQQQPAAWGKVMGLIFFVAFGSLVVTSLWRSVRGVPRTVLDALRSETRIYRRVRRSAAWVLGYAVSVLLTALSAFIPIGSPHDRRFVVAVIWVTSMAIMIPTIVMINLAFGRGGIKAASAHPRDPQFAG